MNNMKTAMQELISELKHIDELPMILGIIKRAEHYLEKEKEQIVEAVGFGLGNKKETELGESYYNKTYNL